MADLVGKMQENEDIGSISFSIFVAITQMIESITEEFVGDI